MSLFDFYMITGLLLGLVGLAAAPNLLRFDARVVLNFCGILAAAFAIRTGVFWYVYSTYGVDETLLCGIMEPVRRLSIQTLLAVWWEDLFYVFPALFALYAGMPRWIVYPLLGVMSFDFMLGHMYQGAIGHITFFYPFISLWAARKWGLGTSMVCHIAYDVAVVLSLFSFVAALGC